MESPPDCHQPQGSGDPSAQMPDNNTTTSILEATRCSTDDKSIEGDVDPAKGDSLENRVKNSDQQEGDNSSNPENPTSKTRATTGVSTGTPTNTEIIDNAALVEGDVDPAKGDSLENRVKNSDQQEGDNSSNPENPTSKTRATTDVDPAKGDSLENRVKNSDQQEGDNSSNPENPTSKTRATTDPPKGDSVGNEDKNSVQQTKDGNGDNSSNRKEPASKTSVTTVKSEEVDHPREKVKTIGCQADSSKGDPSENEKPVDTTPDECSNQNLLRTSAVSQKEPPNEDVEKQKKKISKKEDELKGPTATQTEPAEETGILGGGIKLLIAVAVVALVAMAAQYYFQSKSAPQKTDWQQVDVFLKEMKKVKARFPNQRAELWSRSEIHLKRHLQTSHPTEPVSLILTSGVRAKRTMRCLAQAVASAFSTARNASVLHIDGAGKAGQDSDQVKLDIDRKLQGAFEGEKPVAVIHHLEELPPASTLIFYRYCDHENAAYKKTFLIFTVLLGDEEEIPAETRLSIVEEMVDDYLQKKFLSHGHPVSFNKMDLNKYGGLWSRISHLILPVVAEDRIEQEGC